MTRFRNETRLAILFIAVVSALLIWATDKTLANLTVTLEEIEAQQ
ncbi:MAG: hypothetical protein ACPG4X_22665 [Pikeienuella sp.]